MCSMRFQETYIFYCILLCLSKGRIFISLYILHDGCTDTIRLFYIRLEPTLPPSMQKKETCPFY